MSSPTKRVLAESFIKLLGTRPLNKITVKEIVEEAGVNRQTFYYHFTDVFDLMRWIFEGEVQALDDTACDLQTKLRYALEKMVQERSLVMNIYHSLSREDLELYFSTVVDSIVCEKLEYDSAELPVSDNDLRFIADFYKFAFVGILLDWIRKGMKDDPVELVNKLMLMLNGELQHDLELFSTER
ncbi:hypothetical protein SDC9_67217 [bioreactor metagenome]|uniref:HTH tetR-type domain-containing protein n=1 Tax=bioreactor metagenome TaxID=1076179 RepID=A0A644XYR0_9ZZZZ